MDNKTISFNKKINGQLAAELGALLIEDGTVLVLNHLMVNPAFEEKAEELEDDLVSQALAFAQEHTLKIWPLGPLARTAFFKRKDGQAYLYHKDEK